MFNNFLYREDDVVESKLTYSASSSLLLFDRNTQSIKVDITASGSGTKNFTMSSDNSSFEVTPSAGKITSGQLITFKVLFIGNGNLGSGILTFNDENENSLSIEVKEVG